MFQINDMVKIKNSGNIGKIIRISKKKSGNFYTLQLKNHTKILVPEKDLEPSLLQNFVEDQVTSKHVSITYHPITTDFNAELMIRHQTVLEAIDHVDSFLSSAIAHKEKRLRIIHGRHGGVLRKAVHEYLAKSPFVKNYHLANEYEGSIGVTIVYLK